MKKCILIMIMMFTLVGCSINLSKVDNTPTKQVEKYFSNYQTLTSDVLDELDLVVAKETTLTNKQKEKYREIMKKHYQNISYTIKDETINGDSATVEVEINVTDFYKQIHGSDAKQKQDFYEEGKYNEEAYNDYRLDLLDKAKDKVTYTLYLTLQKDDNDDWLLNDISPSDEQKILGMYNH